MNAFPPSTFERTRETFAEDQAESASYLASYRARGGFDGALRRLSGQPVAASGHMPFPGHRHMGEIG